MQKYIDKYELIEKIGSGTAGVVYRALDPDIGRYVAIKVMKAEYFGSSTVRNQAVERFSAEIRAIGRLSHPSIVSIFDSGITSEGLPYLVMQLVEGKALDLILRDSGGALSPERASKILSQLASAIDYAHSQNVLHRDIKPSNVILTEDDHVFIVDFSTAIVADDTLLPSGQVVGTPQYMAPEVVRGEKASTSSDLYSLGIIAFLLYTGKKPFRDGNMAATFDAVLRQSPFSFAELGCPLGAKLERVLRRALSKSAEDRYQFAEEFIHACEKALGRTDTASFSQVAELSDVGATSTRLRVSTSFDKARRDHLVGNSTLRILLTFCSILLIISTSSLAYILFGLDEFDGLNQKLRYQFGISLSSYELKSISSDNLIKLLKNNPPNQVKQIAIFEAIQRNTAELANTIVGLSHDPDPEIRRIIIYSISIMESVPQASRERILKQAISDSDPLIRAFCFAELAKLQNKKLRSLLLQSLSNEKDPIVARIISQIHLGSK